MDADMAAAVGPDYERNVLAWVQRLLEGQSPPVVYDVGASFGFHTLHWAPCARHVYAFEPADGPRAFLRENVHGLDNVTVLELAIADRDGPATLRRYRHAFTHSLYDRGPIGERRNPEQGTAQVATATLDRLVARNGLLPPGLVKLDAEGAELPALRGAHATLAAHRPLLVVEACAPVCAIAGYTLEDLVEAVAAAGYAVAGLASAYFGEDPPAPEAGANIARFVSEHEDCQLYALDDQPGT